MNEQNEIKIPEGYAKVETGEIIKSGDLCFNIGTSKFDLTMPDYYIGKPNHESDFTIRKIQPDEPAEVTPVSSEIPDFAFPSNDSESYGFGLTKREWFAGQALAGMAMGGQIWVKHDEEIFARRAVRIADAVIEELNKERK